jgi:hypothetical protein
MADGSRSSSANISTPPWLRWVLPSVADLIFVALLSALLFTSLSVKLLGDAGIGWHIRTGQQIVATHSIPRTDPFSSKMRGKAWFAWEWLYDVIVGQLESAWGLNGPLWLTAVVIAAVFAWLFRLLIDRGTDLFVALLFTLLAAWASTIHFLVRPHVLSWLFILTWFWILDSTEREIPDTEAGKQQRLWFLPILMLLWVNVHGGFLVGFVLLTFYWIGALGTWWRADEQRLEESLLKIAAGKRVRQLTLVGVASACASLMNPYGWKLHEHIYGYLSNRFLMNHIEEFQSPDFHGVAQRCFLLLLLVSLAALIARGRQLRLSEVLTVLFAVYAGLYASRNIPVSSILLAVVVAPITPGVKVLSGFALRMKKVQSELKGHIWPLLSVGVTLAIVANAGRVGGRQWIDTHFDPNRMPVGATTFLRSQQINGPILSPDYWGGYLIYRLYPHNSVVIDDRHDFYGEQFLRSYLTMMRAEPGWEDFVKSHGDCIVLPRGSALAAILSRTPEWKVVYSDNIAVVFLPANERDGHRAHFATLSSVVAGPPLPM